MRGVRFVTREIGSLAKPSWRVKAFAGRPLEESDFAAAEEWGRRLEVKGHEALVEGLRGESLNLPDIDDWAAIYAIRLLERVGLDVVYDGEQKRTEMYDHVAAFARGFEPRGTVRSFDNKYYAKAAVTEAPSVPGPQDVEEFEFVRAHTDHTLLTRINHLRHELNSRYFQLRSETSALPVLVSADAIDSRESELNRCLREMADIDPEYVALQTASVVDARELQAALSPRMTLVEYFVAADEVLAFVVTDMTCKVYRHLCPISRVDYLTERFYGAWINRTGHGQDAYFAKTP